MNNALALSSGMTLQQFGIMCAESGFFSDSKDAAQAAVKIQAGSELGFPPIASMVGIYIVKGRVSLSANLMAAAVKRYDSGKYNYRVRDHSDAGCSIEFFERGDSIGISTFTIQDARKAGTQNLDKFPRNMLFARAMSNGCKWYCADVFAGPVYTPEELGAEVDGEGDIVNRPAPITIKKVETLPELPQTSKAEQLKAFAAKRAAKAPAEPMFADDPELDEVDACAVWVSKITSVDTVEALEDVLVHARAEHKARGWGKDSGATLAAAKDRAIARINAAKAGK